jgi:LacI family transcriptional regulator
MAQKETAPVTLRDIAEAAGVSMSTVSRAMNASPAHSSITDAVRRIRRIADEIGYAPNHAARALRGSRSSVVVLADDPTTETTGATIAALERAAIDGEFFVAAAAIGHSARSQLSAVRVVRALRPRAIVVSSSRLMGSAALPDIAAEFAGYRAEGGRIIATGKGAIEVDGSVVFADRVAGETMARHMVSLGRRRYGILAGPRGHGAFTDRTEGFLAVLDDVGVPRRDIAIRHSDHRREEGIAAMMQLLAEQPRIDALLAVNDLFAFAALNAIHESGRSVPGDIALSGIDGQPLSSDVTPALTTLVFPFDDVGTRVAELVMKAVPDLPAEAVVVQGEIVIRASTRGSDLA